MGREEGRSAEERKLLDGQTTQLVVLVRVCVCVCVCVWRAAVPAHLHMSGDGIALLMDRTQQQYAAHITNHIEQVI